MMESWLLRKKNVLGVMMPSIYSSQGSVDDSVDLARNLGIVAAVALASYVLTYEEGHDYLLRKKNVLVLLGLSRAVGLIDAASNAGDCADTSAMLAMTTPKAQAGVGAGFSRPRAA